MCFSAPLAAATRRPNVLLITIDTLRADHVGCYGAEVKTPAIDSLCRDGIMFERAIAQVPLTWPSHAAILTGTYPFHNGVQDFTGQVLSPAFRNVAQAMKAGGYATSAVVSAFVLDRTWGLARGFDHYDDAFAGASFLEKDIGLVERRAKDSVDRALAWLRKRPPGKPFFLWLHLFDPHSPYAPPEPFRSQYKDRPYDGEVAYADSQLQRLFIWLKQSRLYDGTVVVLLSDHGESLGEHGEKEHGFFVYNSTVHVPLVVKPAGARASKRRVGLPVETIDVAPTILEAAGVKDSAIAKQLQGQSLLSLLSGGNHRRRAAYSETYYPFSSFGWSPLQSVQSGDFHYIEAPEPELYDLRSDAAEAKNLRGKQEAMSAVLKQSLTELRSRYASAEPAHTATDPDTAERLRALGYVAARSPVPAEKLHEPMADPKQKLPQFNAILEATDLQRAGQVERGSALLREVQKQEPQMYLIPFLLGEAALRQQQWKQAAAELEKALQLNANFDQAMTALARALHALGDTAAAKRWLDRALEVNPQNYRAWYQIAWMATRADPAAAQAALKKTLALQPNFALARRDLGLLYLRHEEYGKAAAELEKAAHLGLSEAPLHNFLGIAYSRTNRLREAVASYRKALEKDPQLAEAHLNLALTYQRLKQPAEAKNEYAAACRLQADYCKYAPPAEN
ncbi:MAG TPA: sulfatase-like hydrolase/transferase [Terriglobales bacterium]|nr:sulfatase-like hydrolase/transferase [Terriglobales bacterium]